jgi:uncharacterized lipoprotein YbaY
VRTVRGSVVLPPDAPAGVAGLLLVEARDVSLQDAPSVVVAELRRAAVAVHPGGRLEFDLAVPDADPASRTLSLRAHVSIDGSDAVSTGDAITTSHIPLPAAGDVDGLDVPVRMV